MQDNNQEIYGFKLFVYLIIKYWKKLLIVYFAVGLITVGLLLTMHPWYRSTAVVLVQEYGQSSNILQSLGNIIPFNLGIGGEVNIPRYMGFLKTRRILDSVITHFDLKRLYDKKTMEETYNAVLSNLNVIDNEDGTFSIMYSAEDDPQLAADIANYFYDKLREMVIEVSRTSAHNYRVYLDSSYSKAKSDLEEIEKEFVDFQKTTGVVSLEEQVKLSLEGLAELEAQRIDTEIQLKYLSRLVSADNTQLENLKQRLSVINETIDKFRHTNRYANLATLEIPDQGLAYGRLFRDLQIQEKVVSYLSMQLEQAKLEEQKETTNVYLIDRAKPADRKYKPHRLYYLVFIMFVTVVVSLLYLRWAYFIKRNRKELDEFISSV